MTITAGPVISPATIKRAVSLTLQMADFCLGRVPFAITATSVAASYPHSISRAAIRAAAETPM